MTTSTITLTLLAVKRDPYENPEIIECADQATLEMNPEGWAEIVRKAKYRVGAPGSDSRENAVFRFLTVEIDVEKFYDAFDTVDVTPDFEYADDDNQNAPF